LLVAKRTLCNVPCYARCYVSLGFLGRPCHVVRASQEQDDGWLLIELAEDPAVPGRFCTIVVANSPFAAFGDAGMSPVLNLMLQWISHPVGEASPLAAETTVGKAYRRQTAAKQTT